MSELSPLSVLVFIAAVTAVSVVVAVILRDAYRGRHALPRITDYAAIAAGHHEAAQQCVLRARHEQDREAASMYFDMAARSEDAAAVAMRMITDRPVPQHEYDHHPVMAVRYYLLSGSVDRAIQRATHYLADDRIGPPAAAEIRGLLVDAYSRKEDAEQYMRRGQQT